MRAGAGDIQGDTPGALDRLVEPSPSDRRRTIERHRRVRFYPNGTPAEQHDAVRVIIDRDHSRAPVAERWAGWQGSLIASAGVHFGFFWSVLIVALQAGWLWALAAVVAWAVAVGLASALWLSGYTAIASVAMTLSYNPTDPTASLWVLMAVTLVSSIWLMLAYQEAPHADG
jgi:hypothetical protein